MIARAVRDGSDCDGGPRAHAETTASEALARELRQVGVAAGLDAVGVAPATPFHGTRRHLEQRRAAGLHGGMQFTYRNPARSTDPGQILVGARAIIVGALRYPSARTARPDHAAPPSGEVARYASADHYTPLRRALHAIAGRLVVDGWQARVVADDNALVDREAARRAGLGWYGKNTNLLLPGLGSWFVLGGVVTDAPLPPAPEPVAEGCGSCRRCLPACPTGALVAPGVLDARRCLAWLLQATGTFPFEYRVALGARLYGCDDCQEACPQNMVADGAAAGRPTPAVGDEPYPDLLAILASGDDELLDQFGRWYIPQRQPRYLRRNALIALGNTADGDDVRVEQALRRALSDPDPLLRSHAVWASLRLGRHDLLVLVAGECDADVRQELEAASSVPSRRAP